MAESSTTTECAPVFVTKTVWSLNDVMEYQGMHMETPKIIPVLLLVGIAMNGFSAFFFIRLDRVVHVDLYRYGLQFNYEWAQQYWSYSRLVTSLFAAALLLMSSSVILILLQSKTQKKDLGVVICLLLIAGIMASGFSAFFFNRMDYVVHNDLYRYGLQFNYEWAGRYWTYSSLILGLLGATISTSSSSILLILRGRRIDSTKLIHYFFFSAGVASLTFSIIYNSPIVALIGLGLVFWGAVFLYIRPDRQVKAILLGKTMLPSLAGLCQIVTELGYKSQGIYLPPKYFSGFESSKVYLTRGGVMELPSPTITQNEESKLFLNEPDAVLVDPPGAELARLFEKTLGTSFTRVDLQYLQQTMPRLLIEDLEIAHDVEVETEKSKVFVKIKDSVYKDLCEDTMKLPGIRDSMGCPLCSAIACALAKATGKPVTIERQDTSGGDKDIEVEYRILEEE